MQNYEGIIGTELVKYKEYVRVPNINMKIGKDLRNGTYSLLGEQGKDNVLYILGDYRNYAYYIKIEDNNISIEKKESVYKNRLNKYSGLKKHIKLENRSLKDLNNQTFMTATEFFKDVYRRSNIQELFAVRTRL